MAREMVKGKQRRGRELHDFRRPEAVKARESEVLALLVSGAQVPVIARAIGVHEGSARHIIKRALINRAAQEGPTVDAARAIYVDRLELLLSRWLPRAMGEDTNSSGDPVEPDSRALDAALKIMERLGQLNGVTPHQAPSTTVNVSVNMPDDADQARARILAHLDAMRQKQNAIEGELANAGTSLHAIEGTAIEDRPPPPQEAP